MNIGIITHYQRETGNVGSVLQAFALNHYLRDAYPQHHTETVLLESDYRIGKVKTSYIIAGIRKIWGIVRHQPKPVFQQYSERRQQKFQRFAKEYIAFSELITEEKQLENGKYDCLTVGSDVVWSQIRNNYNRVKFLMFKGSEHAVKFSYAASFGRNYIPFENRRCIRKALSHFKGIGVREKSAIELLRSIGIKNAVHVVDPTLLIKPEIWRNMACLPTEDDDYNRMAQWDNQRYVLVFLLNETPWQREVVKSLKEKTGKTFVFVSNGYESVKKGIDSNLYDRSYTDISPEEWIGMIDHADMVITDSFHCTAFSTILNKQFIVLERQFMYDINVRILDYLSSINCLDKFISKASFSGIDLDTFVWDYNIISERMQKMIDSSKAFIDEMIYGE